ncbi:hypothetical protein KC622_00410 [Candidatus Dojkabacteria bacterium]|uniref:Uncharacterized protein n=1 Tax=Candidatus Dojkabacteria bacterium TaxID=2099670 RepID=A0A955HZ13_9BACT|nr:hypothetical protein [Candidatus Dojkabacteria bacterium]
MRDNNYLLERMYSIWEEYFADIPRKNLVLIKFGKYSKRRLGSIKWADTRTKVKTLYINHLDEHAIQDDKRISLITITRYFQNDVVPAEVIDATIGHELVHYAHGFHSPLRKLYKHPHRGGIVDKEMAKRGMENLLEFSEEWLKRNWVKTIRTVGK